MTADREDGGFRFPWEEEPDVPAAPSSAASTPSPDAPPVTFPAANTGGFVFPTGPAVAPQQPAQPAAQPPVQPAVPQQPRQPVAPQYTDPVQPAQPQQPLAQPPAQPSYQSPTPPPVTPAPTNGQGYSLPTFNPEAFTLPNVAQRPAPTEQQPAAETFTAATPAAPLDHEAEARSALDALLGRLSSGETAPDAAPATPQQPQTSTPGPVTPSSPLPWEQPAAAPQEPAPQEPAPQEPAAQPFPWQQPAETTPAPEPTPEPFSWERPAAEAPLAAPEPQPWQQPEPAEPAAAAAAAPAAAEPIAEQPAAEPNPFEQLFGQPSPAAPANDGTPSEAIGFPADFFSAPAEEQATTAEEPAETVAVSLSELIGQEQNTEPEPVPLIEPVETVAIDRGDATAALLADDASPLDQTSVLPNTEDVDGTTKTDAVDALFGESSFQEYDDRLIPERPLPTSGTGDGTGITDGTGGGAGGGLSPKTARILIWSGVGILGALLLVVLFLVGQRIPEWTAAPPADPTEGLPEEGTLPAGRYAWSDLRGGECLTPFSNPWQAEYTVVDCTDPHDAQLLAVVPIEATALPSEEELTAALQEYCPPATLIDFAAAGEYSGLELSSAFPITTGQWEDGQRSYYCFATVADGSSMSTSIQIPPVVEETPAEEAPAEEG